MPVSERLHDAILHFQGFRTEPNEVSTGAGQDQCLHAVSVNRGECLYEGTVQESYGLHGLVSLVLLGDKQDDPTMQAPSSPVLLTQLGFAGIAQRQTGMTFHETEDFDTRSMQHIQHAISCSSPRKINRYSSG